MSIKALQRLYESSKQLVMPTVDTQLPLMERGLDHIHTETQKLNTRYKSSQELQAKAHVFLAQSGIDSQAIAQHVGSLDDAIAFEPIELVNDTNVEEFLKRTHEMIIIETIEEDRRDAFLEFDSCEDRSLQNDWEKLQRRIQGESDEQQDEQLFGIPMSQSMNLLPTEKEELSRRASQYAAVVTTFNDRRLAGDHYDIVDELCKIQHPDNDQTRVKDVWHLVRIMVDQFDYSTQEQRFISRHENISTAVQNRCKLITASMHWLEEQFVQYTDETLLKHASEAQVGGNPSITHRLRAFINITLKKNERWSDHRLEVVRDLPIWTFVYLLFRSGHASTALEFVKENRDMFESAPEFVNYFEEFMASRNRRLEKPTQNAIVAEYQRLEYGQGNVDPYKLVLYKIIGRCELSKKSYPDIVRTTEDYLWLQLMLVRESTEEEEYGYERYCLKDLQNLLNKYGAKQFDPDGGNPWAFFKVLLSTLQFERAVHYLFKHEKSRLEAAHFAITLAYYKLLQIPKHPSKADADLLFTEEDNTVSLNFGRLIHQYTRSFVDANSEEALPYLYTLTLYSKRRGYHNDDMIALCRSYIRDLALTVKDFKSILGTVSAEIGRQPGHVDRHKALADIDNEDAFIHTILFPVAEKFSLDGRYEDAVYTFELATDYNAAVNILNKELGDALQRPFVQQTESQSQQLAASTEAVVRFTIRMLEGYENNQHITKLIEEPRKVTVRVLLQLLQSRELFAKKRYEQALQIISQTGVIPLHDSHGEVQRMADEFEHLDTSISKNVPDMILVTMEMLHSIWLSLTRVNASLRPAMSQALYNVEENIRSVLSFIGMIQYQIPPNMVTKLNKAETIIMNARDDD